MDRMHQMTHENMQHKRYDAGEWMVATEPTWWAHLYVACDRTIAEIECRKACFPKGLCVTLESVDYIFAGGTEKGVRIGFIQYPPFPEKSTFILMEKAVQLGKSIIYTNYQWSFTVVSKDVTVFCSRRKL